MSAGRSHLLIGASSRGTQLAKLAKQFHALPHRNTNLREIATSLMIDDPEMMTYFRSVRANWSEASGTAPEAVEREDFRRI